MRSKVDLRQRKNIMRIMTNTSAARVAALAVAMLVLAACGNAGSNEETQADCPLTISGGESGYWLTAQRSEPSDTRYPSNEGRTIELAGTGPLLISVFDAADAPASIGSMDITDSGSEPCNFTITVGPGGNLSAVQP